MNDADPTAGAATRPRILVAGVGNLFLGDDGFGCEAARRMAARSAPAGVRVVDFGIRAFDLAFALLDGYDGVILIDAMQRGRAPGALYVLEPDAADPSAPSTVPVEAHAMHPAEVLRLARTMGPVCGWVRIVGCEPATFGSEEDPVMGLSGPVAAAVDEAIRLVESLFQEVPTKAGAPGAE